ncbi:DUF998 domain-containing protein [Candidatus Micrarchaeota archaeon]|nr:DUF998 domain-containing protein [Candidatus Micrarchaeota archaeon]
MARTPSRKTPSAPTPTQRNDWAHWAGWIAIVSIIAFAALVNLAVQNYPGFSFSENFLSDLGVFPASADYFNSAVILTGLGVAFFAVAIHKSQRYPVTPAALLSLAAAGFLLAGVGVFNSDVEPHHFLASGGFFLFTALAVLLTGYHWVRNHMVLGWIGLAGGVLLVGFVVIAALSPQPLLQKIAVGAVLIGYFMLALGIIHDHFKK